MNESKKKYWDLLNDTEDMLTGGFRASHPQVNFDNQSAAAAPADLEQGNRVLKTVAEQVMVCTRCGLAGGRTQAVPGEGVTAPSVMVIGEAPGAEEDKLGLPFVGPAGKYLDKWLEAIGLSRRSNCFIANIVKCRPPGNRDPAPEESAACLPYLLQQIDVLKPRAILTVGRIAAQILLESVAGIGAMRGKVYTYRGIPLVPTYHPSGVLRNPDYRQAVWQDLKVLRQVLDKDGV